VESLRYTKVSKAIRTLVIIAAAYFWATSAAPVRGDELQLEYKVKAAFLYNFLKFVDWPAERMADSNEPITIGIIGKDPFRDAFESIKDKKIRDRKVAVRRFKGLKQLEESDPNQTRRQYDALRKCHLLFVCPSEERNVRKILKIVRDHPVLTVGDTRGFLEAGGVLNFLTENDKLRFEINIAVAEQAKLKIRAQLLRLAKRVIKKKSP